MYDTTIGWRFVNPRMVNMYGTASMPETAENVAEKYKIDRAAQDASAAVATQGRSRAEGGNPAEEIVPVNIPGPREA